MPPTSNMRKTTTVTTTVTHVNDLGPNPRRTTSGRAVRANTTRPANYYARPFGPFSTGAAAGLMNNMEADMNAQEANPPGFFPALQFFTDAITALPKEMIKQSNLLLEAEQKVYAPQNAVEELVDEVLRYPVPPRKSMPGLGNGGEGLLSFTASNSALGSATASLVNGVAPNAARISAQNSVTGSVTGEDVAMVETGEELARRKKFHELRTVIHDMLPNLEEKNTVLVQGNRILAQQLSRLDSVLPYIDDEISETARLGSMTHWAYTDNRQKKQMGGTASNRRDVAATNSLAAAASAVHESDIAQARRDAIRETVREKKGRGKEQVDSDFDDKPRKTHAKVAKSKATGAGAGLGITANGEPVKRRKVDKGLAAPGMERTSSAAPKGAKASAKDTPRSTPAGEPATKKPTKAKPAPTQPKRKLGNSAHASPLLASSPLHSTFNAATMDPSRPQSARLRQNSAATHLRHERLADEDSDRPTSAPNKANGEKANGKRKAQDALEERRGSEAGKKAPERANSLKREDTEMAEAGRPQPSRSASNSGRAGRGSKTGTPRNESFPDAPPMMRKRSTRNAREKGGDDNSSTERPAGPGGTRHKRAHSHLVKQLAPFNRSPDLDRHRKDDMDDDLESLDARREGEAMEEHDEQGEATSRPSRSPPKRRLSSRRNTGSFMPASSPPPTSEPDGEEDTAIVDADPEDVEEEVIEDVPDLEPDVPASRDTNGDADEEIDEEDEDSEPGDPDDPNEPKYCYCNRGSYGEMIACDNDRCEKEWFHLGCTELREPPEEEEKWYCADCRPLFVKTKGRGRGGARK